MAKINRDTFQIKLDSGKQVKFTYLSVAAQMRLLSYLKDYEAAPVEEFIRAFINAVADEIDGVPVRSSSDKDKNPQLELTSNDLTTFSKEYLSSFSNSFPSAEWVKTEINNSNPAQVLRDHYVNNIKTVTKQIQAMSEKFMEPFKGLSLPAFDVSRFQNAFTTTVGNINKSYLPSYNNPPSYLLSEDLLIPENKRDESVEQLESINEIMKSLADGFRQSHVANQNSTKWAIFIAAVSLALTVGLQLYQIFQANEAIRVAKEPVKVDTINSPAKILQIDELVNTNKEILQSMELSRKQLEVLNSKLKSGATGDGKKGKK